MQDETLTSAKCPNCQLHLLRFCRLTNYSEITNKSSNINRENSYVHCVHSLMSDWQETFVWQRVDVKVYHLRRDDSIQSSKLCPAHVEFPTTATSKNRSTKFPRRMFSDAAEMTVLVKTMRSEIYLKKWEKNSIRIRKKEQIDKFNFG